MVDDYIPVSPEGDFVFSKANGNELWVLLLEKSWAKLHGSYNRIQSGNPITAYRDLTGAPCYAYDILDKDLFKNMAQAYS